ncbi:MAG: TetR/AcrR family transcriptional regulator [Smithellaceae bacterium]|nr:TetR/AcrR family transcriptional regulator [Syntrophaceae bacterium]MDD4240385.1 TetR/AcrR family transcriptional regulator [Smithellaceae bacterium]NLX52110.1 TetR/AcrR family transcriptional regulator [Deltaproteobacteria bacterium]
MNDQHSIKAPGAAQTLPETGNPEAVNKRQSQIVKKASRLFIKKGYAQTTMRDISKATGINLGNLYNYISSKEDILCLAFETYHDPAVAWLERKGVLDIEDPKEQLQTALHQILIMTHDVMNDILMMYRETRVLPPKFLKIVLKKESDLVDFFEKIITRGMEKKVFRVRDPFFAANMLVFQLSLYPLRSWNLKRYTRDEFLALAEETILKAIIPDYA